jgi:hypothetical protein
MNPLIIILGVVVIFLLYKLYSIYTSAPTQASNIYLGSITQVPPVPTGSINNPGATSYTMGFWIYINTFSAGINEFIGFGDSKASGQTPAYLKTELTNAYANGIVRVTSPKNVCTFSMADNSPTLYVNILTNDINDSNDHYIQSIPVTNNLPIQTWTYVLVSVSTIAGAYADCYLNGKLVNSQQLANDTTALTPYNTQTQSNSNAVNTILYPIPPTNSQDRDIYLTKISWIPTAIDPQTAWAYYNQGNGNPTGTGALSSYHLQMIFTANNNSSTWKIF